MKIKFDRSPFKMKALRLITPERANELGVPAEAPVFCSPYVTHSRHCDQCMKDYGPLVYQVDRETVAQHWHQQAVSWRGNSTIGGIYVYLPEDRSQKWIYDEHLWIALATPRGPLRMGDDRGFQFEAITLKQIQIPQCYMCGVTIEHGTITQVDDYLWPQCEECTILNPLNPLHTNWKTHSTDWTFTMRDNKYISFQSTQRLTLPSNAGVIRR